jgi:isopenicillin N synthase-like dioxygenase
MRSILHHLGEEDPRVLDADLTNSNFGFRLNYYPPLSADALAAGAGRMLGHEDVDLFTLLPASPVEGLQVLNRATMKWVRMVAPPGAIILNAGDYLQRITNDVIPSTTHRVAPPRDPAMRAQCRTSFPLAVYLNETVVLRPLASCGPSVYPVETAIDFHCKITSKYCTRSGLSPPH